MLQRQVIVYLIDQTMRAVVKRMAAWIKPGAQTPVSQSERLDFINQALQSRAPSIRRRPY